MIIHDIWRTTEAAGELRKKIINQETTTLITPTANVLQVRPPRRTGYESEVLLRCGDLQLIEKIDNPVDSIKSFRIGQ